MPGRSKTPPIFREHRHRLLYGNPVYRITLPRRGPVVLKAVPTDPWPGDAQVGAAILRGTYSFSGESVTGETPPWEGVGHGRPWLAALHGFDWLRDLRAVGGDAARRTARTLVQSWLQSQRRWHRVSWSPAVMARRIGNWVGLHDFFLASADDAFRRDVFGGLLWQTAHLRRVLPNGAQGADRLIAMKGLLAGEICLGRSTGEIARSLGLMEREIAAQVLADGGHTSRSPSVIADLLRHLIDLRAVLAAAHHPIPETLQHAIDRMAPAVRFFRHGDGGLALFHGTTEGDPLLLDTVLAQADAKGRPLRSAPYTGFERVLSGRALVLFDCGARTPAQRDSQSHLAPLSFEFSIGRDRLISNCGMVSVPAAMVDALKGPSAHSTLILDGRDPTALFKTTVDRTEQDGATLIDASHSGYETLGFHHGRQIYVGAGGEDLRGADHIRGDRPATVVIRFHLGPRIATSLVGQGTSVLLRLRSGAGWRFRAGGAAIMIEDGLYCGTGEVRRGQQIVLSTQHTGGADETVIKWALHREKKAQ